MAKRKCKKCGRQFESKGTGDCFCSPLCRMTGFFIGGGGDTSKPGGKVSGKPIPVSKPVRQKKNAEVYAKVLSLLSKSPAERWEIARNFTDEEKAYAKRIAKRQLMEDYRFTKEWAWGCETEDTEDDIGTPGDTLGCSDDGSF